MLKDIPYSELKKNGRNYEMMLLRDQHNSPFTDIAKAYGLSTNRVKQLYVQLKAQQIRLYIQHIATVLGHGSTLQIREIYKTAEKCYQDQTYACAYLEKEYQDILAAYRDGEPGMPPQFIKSMPPLQPEPGEKTIARVVEMRETQKASFLEIGKELHMTQAKAKEIYHHFYHEKSLALIKALQERAESPEEKDAIWDYYFQECKTSKKRYDMLMQKDSLT